MCQKKTKYEREKKWNKTKKRRKGEIKELRQRCFFFFKTTQKETNLQKNNVINKMESKREWKKRRNKDNSF